MIGFFSGFDRDGAMRRAFGRQAAAGVVQRTEDEHPVAKRNDAARRLRCCFEEDLAHFLACSVNGRDVSA